MKLVRWRGDALKTAMREELPDALFEAALDVVRAASERAPVDTGELRESGYAATESRSTYSRRRKSYRKENRPPAGQAVAAFAAYYAHFIEYGSGRQPARPFLRPAVDELRTRIGADIAVHLGRKVFRS